MKVTRPIAEMVKGTGIEVAVKIVNLMPAVLDQEERCTVTKRRPHIYILLM